MFLDKKAEDQKGLTTFNHEDYLFFFLRQSYVALSQSCCVAEND